MVIQDALKSLLLDGEVFYLGGELFDTMNIEIKGKKNLAGVFSEPTIVNRVQWNRPPT